MLHVITIITVWVGIVFQAVRFAWNYVEHSQRPGDREARPDSYPGRSPYPPNNYGDPDNLISQEYKYQ